MNIELPPRIATAVTKYAKLVGLTPEAFLNAFLEGFLTSPAPTRLRIG